ncbi:hypothetical protein CVU37_11745 [candidate division BRC1 bacterium HGW-BRC1-1]|jgi:DNA-directed RNA polymerase subunit K/omega|nr:MAG: hypothetical protein CVU37_11745 [candidate division BRC1 bacterium HGW-BRC1-1]
MAKPVLPKNILEVPVRDLMAENRGIYLVVNALARRVRALQSPSERIYSYPPNGAKDSISVATQEFIEDQLQVVTRDEFEVVREAQKELIEARDAQEMALEALREGESGLMTEEMGGLDDAEDEESGLDGAEESSDPDAMVDDEDL